MPVAARAAFVAACLVLARAAGAQQEDTTRARPRQDSAAVLLPAMAVIGSILHAAGPEVGSGVPARTSIIGRAQLDAWRPRSLPGALAGEAGISLYDDLGSPAKLTLVTRGFTASPVVGLPQGVSVFLDGVPVNEPDAGQVNFDLLPLEHVEQIELLSGTASLLGPHSLGGTVNLMTPLGDDPGGIELAYGSHERWSALASHGGRTEGGWRWYAGGGYASEDGWRQLTGATRAHALVNFGRMSTGAGFRVQALPPTPTPRPPVRCPSASTRYDPTRISRPATSRTSISCISPCPGSGGWALDGARRASGSARAMPSASTSTRSTIRTCAASPRIAVSVRAPTGGRGAPLAEPS